MIEVEVEVEAWSADLPDVEALVEQAARAALDAPPLGELSPQGTEGAAPPTDAHSGDGAHELPLSATPSVASRQLPQRGSTSEGQPLAITILLTSDAAVREINARFRGKDAPTNVLSFPAAASARPHLGDIALAHGVCRREADEQHKPFADHVMHLTVHGVLHLLGYDHETDAEAEVMEGLERAILASLGVPDPYAILGEGVPEANA